MSTTNTAYLIRGAKPLGTEATDLLINDGLIVATGAEAAKCLVIHS